MNENAKKGEFDAGDNSALPLFCVSQAINHPRSPAH